MSFSTVIDGPTPKRRHRWRAVTVYGDDALQCEDCRIARRIGTREVWHDGGWIKATVPRCGESVRP